METLDHVVIAVPSLELSSEWFRGAGFTVTPGGRHDELPTENALIAFGDGSYLELLAARDASAREEWRGLASGPAWDRHLKSVSAVARRFLPSLAGADGVVDACLHGASLRARAADLRRAGERYAGPVRMGRERRDGERIEWELLLPESRRIPFWISDRTPRERRVPGSPEATSHANGARGIAGIAVRATGAPLAALALGDLFRGVPVALPDGSTRIDAGTFALEVLEVDEGAVDSVCAARITGCGELPESLRSLGLRPV
jgi:hypothetical protein